MIAKKTLNISAENFFAKIEKSIIYDIKNATGNDIEHIENGFKYSKILNTKLSKASNVDVQILEYTYPLKYKVSFKTGKSISTIEYSALNINDNQCEITYIEDIKYFKKAHDLNFKLVSKFYSVRSKKKILMLLANIEQSVLNTNPVISI